MWNSLRIRLTATLIGLAIGPLLLVGAILAERTYSTVRGQALALQSQVAQNISSEVTGFFQGVVDDLNSLGDEIRDLKQPDRAQLLSLMLNAFSSGPYRDYYNELALLDARGQEQIRVSRQAIVPADQLRNQSEADEFRQPMTTRAAYFSPVWFDDKSGGAFIMIAVPLYEPRSVQLIGVLVTNLRFAAVGDLMAQVPAGQGETVYLVDKEGKVVAHQDRSFNLQNAQIVLSAPAGIQAGLNGTDVVLAANKIQLGEETFYVVAEKPVSEALSLAITTTNTLVIVLVAALLLAGSLGFLSIRQIVSPIEGLAATAKQIAAGNLFLQATVSRRDEIGSLASAFNNMTAQLRDSIGNLEERVAIRTQELEKQAIRLKAAAEVARDAVSAKSPDELLDRSASLIRDHFNFYHVGIFLIDRNREFAVLRASPTEAGREMIANNHRLRVGEQGIVGYVAASGEPRIALDTGVDSVYFRNPLLPATHSEMALPLKTGEGVIGVLDVQSDQPEAFTRDDIAVMQAMTDQLSIALERTRLLQQVETSLQELERTYGQFTAEAWRSFTKSGLFTLGYKFDSVRLEPITELPKEAKAALARGTGSISKIIDKKSGLQTALVPVRLRGQTIGVINVRFQDKGAPDETLAMVEQAADRLAVALETARLLAEARQRAQRDSLISELSGRVRATLDLDTVLKTAAQELQQAFQLKEVEVRLGHPRIPGTGNEAQDNVRKNGKRRE